MDDLEATSAAVGPPAPREVVRAAMLIRLNTFLLGHAGVHPDIIHMLNEFLNKDITPIFPSNGSMGEADITILAHLGLAMAGKGDVFYQNKVMPAEEALKRANLTPIRPYAKDALSIFSSNAYTAGITALVVDEVGKLLEKYELLVALSLEGLNGNISPYLPVVQKIRPYSSQAASAQNIMSKLTGSYLLVPSDTRALQDPLSFRTASHVIGAARDSLKALQKTLAIQLNSSDDNPAVILNVEPSNGSSLQEKGYYVSKEGLSGAVIPTANFEPLPWVLNLEQLGIALGHLSASSVQRTVKLGSSEFTHLSRFLSPNKTSLAFSAVQKPLMYLNANVQQLIMPVSTISYPVAGGIEDTYTNSLLVAERVHTIIDQLYYIMGFEIMHASQAIDLRKKEKLDLKLGDKTEAFYENFRKVVPFLDKDRILTYDIEKSYKFLKE